MKTKDLFGGRRLTTRAERARPRPLSTKDSMHLILRSSQATGDWSFRKKSKLIAEILEKYAQKHGVRVYSFASVGPQLHLHVKLSRRDSYAGFIRAITGALTLGITGTSKLKRLSKKFWDHRPYSRVIATRRALTRADFASFKITPA